MDAIRVAVVAKVTPTLRAFFLPGSLARAEFSTIAIK